MKTTEEREGAAIVIAAFGSSRRGRSALERFDLLARQKYPALPVFWAYTSAILRKRYGGQSFSQALRGVRQAGFHQAVVLPLYIFPGIEYQQIVAEASACRELRLQCCPPLIHSTERMEAVLEIIGQDFLDQTEGVNILALHGTPRPADPVNYLYQDCIRVAQEGYANVYGATLEGVPDSERLFAALRRDDVAKHYSRARLIPLLYVAGMHVEDDLMGEQNSWRQRLAQMGLSVDCLRRCHQGKEMFKSLADYPQINELFLSAIAPFLHQLNMR